MGPVLIIEDNLDLQSIYEMAFQNANIPIILSSSGLEALTKIRSIAPSLILLDIMMPGDISGIQFIKTLNENGVLKYPIIVCSNLSSKETMEECKKLGCLDYIIKANVSVSDLIIKVKNFLESNKQETSQKSIPS